MMNYERRFTFGSNHVRHALSSLPSIPAGPEFDKNLHARIEDEGGEIPHMLHSLPLISAPGDFEEQLWQRIGSAATPSRRAPFWMALAGGWNTVHGLIYLVGGAAAIIAVIALSSRWNATPNATALPAAKPATERIGEDLFSRLPLTARSAAPVERAEATIAEAPRRASRTIAAAAPTVLSPRVSHSATRARAAEIEVTAPATTAPATSIAAPTQPAETTLTTVPAPVDTHSTPKTDTGGETLINTGGAPGDE